MGEETGGRAEKEIRRGAPEFMIDFTFVKDINREIARVVAMSAKTAFKPQEFKRMILIQEEREAVDVDLINGIRSHLGFHVGIDVASAEEEDTAHNFYRYNTEVRRTSRIGGGILCLPAIILPLFYVKSGGIWYSGIVEGKKNVEEFLRFLLEEIGK